METFCLTSTSHSQPPLAREALKTPIDSNPTYDLDPISQYERRLNWGQCHITNQKPHIIH